MKFTALESQILSNLRANVEGHSKFYQGKVWTSVYLPNAKPKEITAHQFAGVLSSLEQKGLYESSGDNYFGYVVEVAA